ncbi:MAG: HTH-type transcriptional regulator DmlR [Paracidovorax wautersii]|uniref:HTH-type transcriptional regulator DmlR n=1 Tax=Paracidovorax wautersii TaxID=1177982 RepID=A0A7V8FN60_9BURK|nr:MAG: HTH-type transcriptional regulator DmlR [Paracidovorax wautersii]
MPKSRLSRRVAELEACLGVRLLQRTTRKLSLTAAGQVFYRHCAAMKAEALAATEAIARLQSEPRGRVRVTCPVTVAQVVLAPVLPRFMQAHPQVRIDMEVTNRVVDLVDEGVDVALRVRTTLEESGSLVIKRLGLSKTELVASPRLLARHERVVRPQDLARLPTVTMSGVEGRTSWQLEGPDGAVFAFEHEPLLLADDMLTLKSAMLEGIGVGYLPDYMCSQDMAEGRLVSVLPGWAPPLGIVHAVFPSRRGLVPAVRAFLDFLGQELGPQTAQV